MQIDENSQHSIRNAAIGDMNLEELEKEAISRTLQYFNNNRRAAAKSLGMSERTLYRKIDQYNLGRKIKRSNGKNG
jgi:DNA-binding NtrC family response regulator